MKLSIFLSLFLSAPAFAHVVKLPKRNPSSNEKIEWISMDPHVHTKEKDAQGCPNAASKTKMIEYGQRYNLQLVVDNYWGPHRPTPEELKRFPLPFVEKRTPEEEIHGNNHQLQISRDEKTGQPTATNLLDGLEVSWFISDRGSHLGILGSKSLDWFFDQKGNDKIKTAVEILEALRKETDDHNQNLKKINGPNAARNSHFVIVSHLFQWNPLGYPQIVSKDFGRPFELPITVAFEEWGVKGLGTEGTNAGSVGEDIPNSPIDTGTFDVLVKLSNSGFKMALVGESDYSCLAPDDADGPPGNGMGKPSVLRTLVGAKKGPNGEVTYQAVLDAAIAGRTVVANMGTSYPKLGKFTVEHDGLEAGLGETLKVRRHKGAVTVRIKNLPEDADVLVNGGKAIKNINGKVIRTLKGGRQRRGNGTIKLNQSSWIVAQTGTEITSPIYVEINNQPIRVSAEDPCYFIGHIERAKLELSKPAKDDLTISDYPEARKSYLLKRYSEAQEVYVKRFNEAKKQHGGSPVEKCFLPIN